ncbi:hypothetical protein DFH06DRAFT_1174799 [Mycena polygramma]|nr:hypothetical protein DFH06DRAFT_1174799 [Mycena polygramma]
MLIAILELASYMQATACAWIHHRLLGPCSHSRRAHESPTNSFPSNDKYRTKSDFDTHQNSGSSCELQRSLEVWELKLGRWALLLGYFEDHAGICPSAHIRMSILGNENSEKPCS